MLRIEKSFCTNILGIHTFHLIKKKIDFLKKKRGEPPLNWSYFSGWYMRIFVRQWYNTESEWRRGSGKSNATNTDAVTVAGAKTRRGCWTSRFYHTSSRSQAAQRQEEDLQESRGTRAAKEIWVVQRASPLSADSFFSTPPLSFPWHLPVKETQAVITGRGAPLFVTSCVSHAHPGITPTCIKLFPICVSLLNAGIITFGFAGSLPNRSTSNLSIFVIRLCVSFPRCLHTVSFCVSLATSL